MDAADRYPFVTIATFGLAVPLALIAAGLCVDGAALAGSAVPGGILPVLVLSPLPAVSLAAGWRVVAGGYRRIATLITLAAGLTSLAGAAASLLAALGACAVDGCSPPSSAAAGLFARATLLFLVCSVLGVAAIAAGRGAR
jgi:hypothetical protein